MAAPRREATSRLGGPLRALPVVAIAASIVAIAAHYDGFVATGRTVSRAASTFDVRKNAVYVCPMDPDVRSNGPGKCRRCGMALVAGIPDPVEFHLDLTTAPSPPAKNETTTLEFHVHDPWKDRPVQKFVTVHEKLFHAFVVSQDLTYFNHGHPVMRGDGVFALPVVLPKGGMFRVLGDFYPDGATPQLLTETLFVPGAAAPPVTLSRDYSTKSDRNMKVALTTLPEQATAGNRTRMTFRIDPADGFEKYLGAWGHMLAASDDLIDMIHLHPIRADGADVQFDVVFPRPRGYRVWVQFQRSGVVNTVHFDVPVEEAPK
jgi:heavy metal-binding protein